MNLTADYINLKRGIMTWKIYLKKLFSMDSRETGGNYRREVESYLSIHKHFT